MDKLDRIHQLHRLFSSRRSPIASARLCQELECSRATLMRDLEWLRDIMGAPIIYDHEHNGYCYDPAQSAFELPGLWLNASELHALLSLNHLLAQLQPGVLNSLIGPVRERIEKLLGARQLAGPGLAEKVLILSQHARQLPTDTYETVIQALAEGRQIHLTYHARRGETTPLPRQISPQRLVHYRDNWYLDAWCHTRQGLRSFSLDRMQQPSLSDAPAQQLAASALDEHFASAYGIFNGAAREWALLRFSAHAAQWVADECWHPQQKSRWLSDGRYELQIPFAESPELLGEILRWMPEVQVVEPQSLKEAIIAKLQAGLALQQSGL